MSAFLEEVALDIINKYNNRFHEICIVIPNKRTGSYLKKHIGKIIGTGFSPRIITIETLVRKLTGLALVDKFTLIFELFQIYNTLLDADEEPATFDRFMSIAEILLSDFNEIDAYLVDVNQIFSNIQNIKEVDDAYSFLSEEQRQILQQFWKSFSVEQLSEEKERFLSLWNKVPKMYKILSEKLLAEKKAYQGLMFRQLAQHIQSANLKDLQYSAWFFVGFNALNASEKLLFKHYKNTKTAFFYWDTDKHYHLNPDQEAGEFLRTNFEYLGEKSDQIPENFTKTKKITLIGVPLRIGQAKSVATILQSEQYLTHNFENEYPETAIVMADEHLLFPVMHSLPDDFTSVNVTMGYPFSQTSLYSLIDAYLNLHRKEEKTFFHRDVFSIVMHPILKRFYGKKIEDFIENARKFNRFRISFQSISNLDIPILTQLFQPYKNRENGLLIIENLMEILFNIFVENKKAKEEIPLENEYIYQLYIQLKRIFESLNKQSENTQFSYAVVERILLQEMRNIRIPFESPNTDGLQLMGVIETRNIDFKNVVVMGLNESIFPSLSRSPSFISENIRQAFGLTVIKHQDAIFAYLFYRLLQRSENITLVYNNITGNNSGELSRFVQQVMAETKHEIKHLHFKQDLIPAVKSEIKITSNPEIQKKLDAFVIREQKSDRRFSPSSIATYLDCRLKFYFQYIAQIKETPTINEELQANDMGTILHAAIERLYKDYLKDNNKKILEEKDFLQLSEMVDRSIDLAFMDFWHIENVEKLHFEANNIIIRDVIKQQIESILRHDKKNTPFEIVGLEARSQYVSQILVEVEDQKFQVGIQGIIDRIDKKDNIYRVVDYKTGKTDDKLKSWAEVFDRSRERRKTHFMQVFWYADLFFERFKNYSLPLRPAIYSVTQMRKSDYSPYLDVKTENQEEQLNEYNCYSFLLDFKKELSSVFAELYSSDLIFDQTENKKKCEYCPFSIICGR